MVWFKNAFVYQFTFDSDALDLVTIWNVLHWISLNENIQSLDELIRVCKKYLLIMDFSAKKITGFLIVINKDSIPINRILKMQLLPPA